MPALAACAAPIFQHVPAAHAQKTPSSTDEVLKIAETVRAEAKRKFEQNVTDYNGWSDAMKQTKMQEAQRARDVVDAQSKKPQDTYSANEIEINGRKRQ